jgi:hypothetical protein
MTSGMEKSIVRPDGVLIDFMVFSNAELLRL